MPTHAPISLVSATNEQKPGQMFQQPSSGSFGIQEHCYRFGCAGATGR